MKNNLQKSMKTFFIVVAVVTAVLTVFFAVKGAMNMFNAPKDYQFLRTETFTRATTAEEEDYDEDSTKCEVEFTNKDESLTMVVTYSFEEWEELAEGATIKGYVYGNSDAFEVALPEKADAAEINMYAKDSLFNENSTSFATAVACALVCASFVLMAVWGSFFTTYEKCWFLLIMVLASVVSIFAPEESCNGVNGLWIMILYLADTFLNILCELLISKQSKWNFIVSLFVEVTEIAICVVLAYRFATMLSTLFFWIPIDILSFINWHKHPDKKEDDLTKVRSLSGLAEVLILLGIVVWTVVVGYFLSGLDITTDLFHGNEVLATVVCYLDACATAVGICNGLFIFFRIKEQWIAWFIEAILEGVINIISGQWVLLPLKLGYLTNSTYGFIKWTKYIKVHKEAGEEDKKFF